jgi:hypothetical protein
MKSKKLFIARGMLAAALAFALVLAGCGKKNSGGGSSGGSASGGSGAGDAVQAAVSAAARETPASDFSYDLSGDGQGIVIKGYTGDGGKVAIPATIEDIPVVEIEDYTFRGQTNNGIHLPANNITEIVIPDGVTRIGLYAFNENEGLKSVTLPDGLKKIEDHTFDNCSNLTTINLPAGLEKIGFGALSACGELNNLIIPASLTGVKFTDVLSDREDPNNFAFSECGKLPIKTRQTIQGWGYKSGF